MEWKLEISLSNPPSRFGRSRVFSPPHAHLQNHIRLPHIKRPGLMWLGQILRAEA
jgi:hypothetical protein